MIFVLDFLYETLKTYVLHYGMECRNQNNKHRFCRKNEVSRINILKCAILGKLQDLYVNI